jgi:hypothetical protein
MWIQIAPTIIGLVSFVVVFIWGSDSGSADLKAKRTRKVVRGVTLFAAFASAGFSIYTEKAKIITTPQNAKANITKWSEELGLKVQVKFDPQCTFSLNIVLRSDVNVGICNTTAEHGFLTFYSSVRLDGSHLASFNQLPPRLNQRVKDEVVLEFGRQKIGYTFEKQQPQDPNVFVAVFKTVPITDGFSKRDLMAYFDEIESDWVLTRQALFLSIEHNSELQNKCVGHTSRD